MRRMVPLYLALVVVISLLFGCSTHRVYYDIGLFDVERPESVVEQYGNSEVTKFNEQDIQKSHYEDGLVDIMWFPTATEIDFILINKSNQDIQITWDGSAFYDSQGNRSKVMHKGVKYGNRNKEHSPTVIAAGETHEDYVFPVDNMHYETSIKKEPLFPSVSHSRKADDLSAQAEGAVGKQLKIVLPIQVDGNTIDYTFIFKVDGFEVR